MTKLSTSLTLLLRHSDLWLITGLFGAVLLLILPIPPAFLDCLLALSIALSLLTLLIVGLFIGCLNAWHWVAKEDRAMRRDLEVKDE